MPQQAWNAKRERQYERIKEGLKERGRSDDVAEEIAAWTVNKARGSRRVARSQPELARRYLLRPPRRAPFASGPGGRRHDQLYNEAKDRGLKGRSR